VTALTLAMVFGVGFIIMTPIGPVSTICIRRSLIYGPWAGIAAGAGNAVALAAYATVGISGSALLPHFFAAYSSLWHIVVAAVLILAAFLLWKARPLMPTAASTNQAAIAGGFGTTLAIALANPADIVLFAALFAGLGIAVHSTLEHVFFCATIFAGGCAYWIAVALTLNRWRCGLTAGNIRWLNRASSTLMLVGAGVSVVSLLRH
jgi:putative LysE/RhtB family amino acid efflux pump